MASPAEFDISGLVEWGMANKEVVLATGTLIIAAFTAKQRGWILRRDDNECQNDDEEVIHGGRLEVDHILPQGIGYENGLTEDQIDTPMNGITECVNHHRGHPTKSRHPDAHEALWTYQTNPDSFKELRPKRNAKLKKGEAYWNTDQDEDLAAKALARTRDYLLEHPEDRWPQRRKRG